MSNSLKEAFLSLASSLGHCQENSRSIVDALKRGCSDLAENAEGGGGSEHTYSTTEQKIGKWVDGSDLYEITFTGLNTTTNGAAWQTIAGTTIQNMAHLIDCRAYAVGGNDNLIQMNVAESAKSSDSAIQLSVGTADWNRAVNIIIAQYTKTS